MAREPRFGCAPARGTEDGPGRCRWTPDAERGQRPGPARPGASVHACASLPSSARHYPRMPTKCAPRGMRPTWPFSPVACCGLRCCCACRRKPSDQPRGRGPAFGMSARLLVAATSFCLLSDCDTYACCGSSIQWYARVVQAVRLRHTRAQHARNTRDRQRPTLSPQACIPNTTSHTHVLRCSTSG